MQALDVLAKGTQAAQVTLERSQLIVQIPQRPTEPVGVIEVGCELDVGIHSEKVIHSPSW